MLRRGVVFLIVSILLLSCEEIINVENISNDTIQILAPTNNAQLADGAVSFNWQGLSGADGYELQIATPNFAAATQIVLDSTVSSNSFIKTLTAGAYEWRIRGVNSAFATPYTANSFSIVNDLSDDTVQLSSPEDDATVAPGTISFGWNAVSGAENYRLQIATPDFSSGNTQIVDMVVTDVNFNQTLEANTYRWRVKAMNAISATAYSEYNLTVQEP